MSKPKISVLNRTILGLSIALLVAGGFTAGVVPVLFEHEPSPPGEAVAPQSEITPGKAGLESGALQARPIDPVEPESQDTNQILKEVAAPSLYYPYQEQRSDYEGLYTEEAKALYQAIAENVYEISSEKNTKEYYSLKQVELGRIIPEDQIRIAITAFKNDNPQIFWIANVYSRAYTGGHTVVQLYSHVSASECNQMIRELNAAVENLLADMPENLTEMERELFLFNRIAGGCTYDTQAAQDSSLWHSYTSYGALVEGKSVCEGYARSLQQMLGYAGMKSRLVNGMAGGTIHMWNLVQVDGEWYHMDPTWNDEDALIRYDYFNVTDEIIEKDHQPSPNIRTFPQDEVGEYLRSGTASYNLPLPPCTSFSANYLLHRGISIGNFNKNTDNKVIHALIEAAQEKRPAVYFYIEESINYDMAVSRIFQTDPYKLMYYVNQANQKLEKGEQIIYEKITYILGGNSRGITVKLTYG